MCLLGGVGRSTGEAVLLCEAAGYDMILVETVGVGQAEYAVADMVDMFILLTPPAAGDELQGMKRGVIELVDMVIVTKADGDLVRSANLIRSDYLSALRFINPKSHELYFPQVCLVSCLENRGIDKVWQEMCNYRRKMEQCGLFEIKRADQQKAWMWYHIQHQILTSFKEHPAVRQRYAEYEGFVIDGIMTPGAAADELLYFFMNQRH
jgi:LAO/AO transport system kinase